MLAGSRVQQPETRESQVGSAYLVATPRDRGGGRAAEPAGGGGVMAEVVPLVGPRYGSELPVAKFLLGHYWAKIDGLHGKLLKRVF